MGTLKIALLLTTIVLSLSQLTLPLFHELSPYKRHFLTLSEAHKQTLYNSHGSISHLQPAVQQEDYRLLSSGASFFLPLQIAGLNYYLQVDTGSSDVFIKGQQTKGNPPKKYQCGQPCLSNSPKYNISYWDGDLQTYETKLSVKLGDHVFNQSILVAFQAGPNYDFLNGILGLSFSSLARNPNPTFLQTLLNQKIIANESFSVNLNFQKESRSFITLGSVDKAFFTGNMTYVYLSSQTDYVVDIEGMISGSSGLLKMQKALFDTGNTAISIPKSYEYNIISSFNVNGNVCVFQNNPNSPKFSQLFCTVSNFNSLPNLVIVIKGHYFNVEKQSYLRKCVRNASDSSNQNISTGIWYCITYVESISSTTLFIGDGFFNRYYAHFDLENYRIGLAKNKENLSLLNIVTNQTFDQSVMQKFSMVISQKAQTTSSAPPSNCERTILLQEIILIIIAFIVI